MVHSSLHRNSSNLTVQLTETELLPSHTSPDDLSSQPPNLGFLVIKANQGCQYINIKTNSVLTIGRSCSSSIVISHPTASLHHLIIYSVPVPSNFSDSLIFCQDLNSTNGTFCNNRRLPNNEPFLLTHGDCIQLRHGLKMYLLQPNLGREEVEDVKGLDINYRIYNRLVGQGGTAKVFLAQNCVSRQYVACKVIRINVSKPKTIVYAKNEIDILSKLSHPNIISVFSSIKTATSIVIFEPLFCGDLQNFICDMHTDGLDEVTSKFIIYQILLAVTYLHSHGITHRDLKLENILIHRPVNPVIITLADFGLARRYLSRPKRMNTFCGSLDFLAPEMLRMLPSVCPRAKRKGYGKEVDIWAIGVIAYVIMSGELPFVDETPRLLLQSIVCGGVFFSSAWTIKSDLAKRFVRSLLREDAVLRPTAAEALSHAFISSSEEELKIIYDEMVMTPSTAKRDTFTDAERERLGHGNAIMENESQHSLGVAEENVVETRERKRQYTEGKENEVEDDGDVGQSLKKRRLYE